MGKTKVESLFSDPEVAELFATLAALPAGKRTGRVVQEWAKARGGHYVSERSGIETVKGAFQTYLDELKAKADRAQQVAAYAREGLSMSDAASVRLSESVFDELMSRDPSSFTAEERDIYSKIIARARSGDQRAEKLAADLKLRDEQLDALRRERTEWEEQRAKIVAVTEKVRAATPATADEVRAAAVAAIDDIMGIKPKPKK